MLLCLACTRVVLLLLVLLVLQTTRAAAVGFQTAAAGTYLHKPLL